MAQVRGAGRVFEAHPTAVRGAVFFRITLAAEEAADQPFLLRRGRGRRGRLGRGGRRGGGGSRGRERGGAAAVGGVLKFELEVLDLALQGAVALEALQLVADLALEALQVVALPGHLG